MTLDLSIGANIHIELKERLAPPGCTFIHYFHYLFLDYVIFVEDLIAYQE